MNAFELPTKHQINLVSYGANSSVKNSSFIDIEDTIYSDLENRIDKFLESEGIFPSHIDDINKQPVPILKLDLNKARFFRRRNGLPTRNLD